MGAWGVQRNRRGEGVTLRDFLLVEDDGPGSTYGGKWTQFRSPAIEVRGATRVRKVFHVERPEALAARLYIPRGVDFSIEGKPAAVVAEINGRRINVEANRSFPEIPPGVLKPGDNEVVLYAEGDNAVRLPIAPRDLILRNAPDRTSRPPRSFKSDDAGKTWRRVDGELMLRLNLEQYPAEGHFLSPTLDLWSADTKRSVLFPKATVRSLALAAEADTPAGTRVELVIRTGSTPVYEPQSWSDWVTPGQAPQPGHRYAQWKAVLATTDPRTTPVLKSVALKADLAEAPVPAWAEGLRVAGSHNEAIRYASIPFAYEAHDHPKLTALREGQRLDQVVAGAKSELEKFMRLRGWVAKQWKYRPPFDVYPPWDAHEILKAKSGFCVQFAIVYMQCCLSLGYQARFVFGYNPGWGTGHEVCEVWSNELRKWVVMDPCGDVHHVDLRSGGPLGMLEIHDRVVRHCFGDRPIDPANRLPNVAASQPVGACRGMETTPSRPDDASTAARGDMPFWAKWAVLRMMPRNDFYAHPYPVPPSQGVNWDWTGYVCWEDAQTPRYYNWRYAQVTARRSDWEWTLNQVRFGVAYGPDPATLLLQFGTVTPQLETFLVNLDGKGWRPSASRFAWKLHKGVNRVEMRVRTRAGIEGPVSFIQLNYE